MAEKSGTIVSQCGYSGGWHSYGSSSQFAGRTSSAYYPYILKFTTPTFSGVSESLTIKLGAYDPFGYGSVTLRYALCSSDGNKANYVGKSGTVTDSYKIANGTKTFSGLTNYSQTYAITIDTAKLSSNTTYYLYLWAYSSSTTGYVEIANTSYHSVSLIINEGVVYIDNGSSFGAYQVYIDNGSSWDLYIPYIDNGTSWDLYS